MTDLPPFDDADLFDEAGYLRLYPGIAQFVMQRRIANAWAHYTSHGREEGRRANDVDPDFYLAAYSEIERDLGHPPTEADAAPHYVTLGRARGYLPNARAARMANGAALASPFGGLWTDQANALDLIQARLELGRLRRRDAAMLRRFALEGIVQLNRPNDEERIRDAAMTVSQAFTGMFPDLLFAVGAPVEASLTEPLPWRPELTEQNTAVLDPHMVSRKIRGLLLDPAVTDFLSLLFDAPPKLTASRGFPRQAAAPERDVAWLAHSLPLQCVAVTFDLEDSDEGLACVWPGSHRLPDLPWCGQHVTLAEAKRSGAMGVGQEMTRRQERVRALVQDQEPRRLNAFSGTRMIRHVNLIHSVDAPSASQQRRTLTAWYCPSYVTPCYTETKAARVHRHDGHAFCSGAYPDLDPLD